MLGILLSNWMYNCSHFYSMFLRFSWRKILLAPRRSTWDSICSISCYHMPISSTETRIQLLVSNQMHLLSPGPNNPDCIVITSTSYYNTLYKITSVVVDPICNFSTSMPFTFNKDLKHVVLKFSSMLLQVYINYF